MLSLESLGQISRPWPGGTYRVCSILYILLGPRWHASDVVSRSGILGKICSGCLGHQRQNEFSMLKELNFLLSTVRALQTHFGVCGYVIVWILLRLLLALREKRNRTIYMPTLENREIIDKVYYIQSSNTATNVNSIQKLQIVPK